MQVYGKWEVVRTIRTADVCTGQTSVEYFLGVRSWLGAE